MFQAFQDQANPRYAAGFAVVMAKIKGEKTGEEDETTGGGDKRKRGGGGNGGEKSKQPRKPKGSKNGGPSELTKSQILQLLKVQIGRSNHLPIPHLPTTEQRLTF